MNRSPTGSDKEKHDDRFLMDATMMRETVAMIKKEEFSRYAWDIFLRLMTLNAALTMFLILLVKMGLLQD